MNHLKKLEAIVLGQQDLGLRDDLIKEINDLQKKLRISYYKDDMLRSTSIQDLKWIIESLEKEGAKKEPALANTKGEQVETHKKIEQIVLASGRATELAAWKKGYYDDTLEVGDFKAKVWGDVNEDDWRWEVFDGDRELVANGRAKSIEEAKKKAEQAMKSEGAKLSALEKIVLASGRLGALAAPGELKEGDKVVVDVDLRDGKLKKGSQGVVVDASYAKNFVDIKVNGKVETVNVNQIKKV